MALPRVSACVCCLGVACVAGCGDHPVRSAGERTTASSGTRGQSVTTLRGYRFVDQPVAVLVGRSPAQGQRPSYYTYSVIIRLNRSLPQQVHDVRATLMLGGKT